MVPFRLLAAAVALCCLGLAQLRVSDEAVERLMASLREDSKKFRSSFDAAISKSAARRTGQDKEAKSLVARFVKETDTMFSHFKDKKNGDAALLAVLRSSDQIDIIVTEARLGRGAEEDWQKIKAEIASLSEAFGAGRSR